MKINDTNKLIQEVGFGFSANYICSLKDLLEDEEKKVRENNKKKIRGNMTKSKEKKNQAQKQTTS